jgi:hypothetical protein
MSELTRPEKLAKVSDQTLLDFAAAQEPGSDTHYDAIMEVCSRGLKDPEAGVTACNLLPELKANLQKGIRLGPCPTAGRPDVLSEGRLNEIKARDSKRAGKQYHSEAMNDRADLLQHLAAREAQVAEALRGLLKPTSGYETSPEGYNEMRRALQHNALIASAATSLGIDLT